MLHPRAPSELSVANTSDHIKAITMTQTYICVWLHLGVQMDGWMDVHLCVDVGVNVHQYVHHVKFSNM